MGAKFSRRSGRGGAVCCGAWTLHRGRDWPGRRGRTGRLGILARGLVSHTCDALCYLGGAVQGHPMRPAGYDSQLCGPNGGVQPFRLGQGKVSVVLGPQNQRRRGNLLVERRQVWQHPLISGDILLTNCRTAGC